MPIYFDCGKQIVNINQIYYIDCYGNYKYKVFTKDEKIEFTDPNIDFVANSNGAFYELNGVIINLDKIKYVRKSYDYYANLCYEIVFEKHLTIHVSKENDMKRINDLVVNKK